MNQITIKKGRYHGIKSTEKLFDNSQGREHL